jgi:hypothetical protein
MRRDETMDGSSSKDKEQRETNLDHIDPWEMGDAPRT